MDGTQRLVKHPNPQICTRWIEAGENKFTRLAQGCKGMDGLDVIKFIAEHSMPAGKTTTCARCVVDCHPEKDEPWRLQITCGGDKLGCCGETATHGTSMETVKCQLNNVASQPHSKAATCDVSNMHLASLPPEAEHAQFGSALIPPSTVEARDLTQLATPDGHMCAQVNKA